MKRLFPLVLIFFIFRTEAACKVIDPELQSSYSGPCVSGLAEGFGSAEGTARYRGGFKAGLKDGRGVKTWPNGDRYEGDFVADRKQGRGVYVWGRGPWEGERYEGEYANDQREGSGTYRWPTGDVYSGPWKNDAIAGYATPMMLAHAKFQEEARAAVARIGQRVCRAMQVGIAERDWVRGSVVELDDKRVGVRIDDPGRFAHVIGGADVRRGEISWDLPEAWTPCF